MNLFAKVHKQFSSLLKSNQVDHAFSGQLAFRYWAAEIEIQEIELLVWCPYGSEAALFDIFREQFGPFLSGQSAASATRFRQILLATPDAGRARIILCATPFERTLLDRALQFDVPILSAEDLLLLTLFRSPAGVLAEAQALIQSQRMRLQWPYIEYWLPQLAELKGDARPLEALAHVRANLARI